MELIMMILELPPLNLALICILLLILKDTKKSKE